MAMYLVTWKIDIDASSKRAAARKALELLRMAESTALCFEVTRGPVELVDLHEEHPITAANS